MIDEQQLEREAQWVKAASVGEVVEGSVTSVQVGDQKVALAVLDGTFYAVGGQCPHRGGPLDCGELRGTELVCPWHRLRYDIRTGVSTMPPGAYATESFPVRVSDDTVEIQITTAAKD